jgi:hypothetical protein
LKRLGKEFGVCHPTLRATYAFHQLGLPINSDFLLTHLTLSFGTSSLKQHSKRDLIETRYFTKTPMVKHYSRQRACNLGPLPFVAKKPKHCRLESTTATRSI